jgi:hypothetical protein
MCIVQSLTQSLTNFLSIPIDMKISCSIPHRSRLIKAWNSFSHRLQMHPGAHENFIHPCTFISMALNTNTSPILK